jgi:hypothetical protein
MSYYCFFHNENHADLLTEEYVIRRFIKVSTDGVKSLSLAWPAKGGCFWNTNGVASLRAVAQIVLEMDIE